jgi:hypothetical protein
MEPHKAVNRLRWLGNAVVCREKQQYCPAHPLAISRSLRLFFADFLVKNFRRSPTLSAIILFIMLSIMDRPV